MIVQWLILRQVQWLILRQMQGCQTSVNLRKFGKNKNFFLSRLSVKLPYIVLLMIGHQKNAKVSRMSDFFYMRKPIRNRGFITLCLKITTTRWQCTVFALPHAWCPLWTKNRQGCQTSAILPNYQAMPSWVEFRAPAWVPVLAHLQPCSQNFKLCTPI